MADLQKAVDEIRFRMQADYCAIDAELQQLATIYAEACREVNARLRRCGEYLRQDLRTEAIHLAEMEPRVLDQLAMLDFPERAEWDEVVSMNDLMRPDPFLLDIAESLNEAYASQEPLTALLDRHRLLALARAPLPKRLEVLRELSRNDAASHWEEDIRGMELARFREIESLLNNGRGAGLDLDAIQVELRNGPWFETPPRQLLDAVRRTAQRVQRQGAQSTLEDLEPQLLDAFAELDLTRARGLRDQWLSIVDRAQLPEGHALLESVSPALAWIADEDSRAATEQAYQLAVRQLERALNDDQATVEELTRLFHQILKLDRDLPTSLEQLLRTRMRLLEVSASRRHKLVVGGSVLALTAVIGLIALFFYSQVQNKKSERIIVAVGQLLDGDQLKDARDLVDKNSDLPDSESWLAIKQRLADAEKVDGERVARLTELIRDVRVTESHFVATSKLAEAHGLARTGEEKLTVGSLEHEWNQKNLREVSLREEAVLADIQKATDTLQKMSDLLEAGNVDAGYRAMANSAKGLVDTLAAAKDSSRQELRSQIDLVQKRYGNLLQTAGTIQFRQARFGELTSLSHIPATETAFADRLSSYQRTLEDYATTLPKDRISQDFVQSQNDRPLWEGVVRWNRLLSGWTALSPDTPSEIPMRIAACREIVDQYPESPAAKTAAEYQVYLESLSRLLPPATGVDNSLPEQMRRLFSSRIFSDIHAVKVRTDSGEQNYLVVGRQSYKPNQSNVVEYIPDVAVMRRSKKSFTSDKFVSFDSKLAAHVGIADLAKLRLNAFTFRDWEPLCIELANEIATKPDLDEFFRYYLLRRILTMAGEGSLPLQLSLVDFLNQLDDDQIDLSVAWVDPDDEAARKSRARAATLIGRAGKLEVAWNKVQSHVEAINREVFTTAIPVGWLDQSASGAPQLQSAWSAPSEGSYSLRVPVPQTASKYATWKDVGQVVNGSITLYRALDSATLVAGRLVFAIKR